MSIYARYSCIRSPFSFSRRTEPPGIICFTGVNYADGAAGLKRTVSGFGAPMAANSSGPYSTA